MLARLFYVSVGAFGGYFIHDTISPPLSSYGVKVRGKLHHGYLTNLGVAEDMVDSVFLSPQKAHELMNDGWIVERGDFYNLESFRHFELQKDGVPIDSSDRIDDLDGQLGKLFRQISK